MKFGVREITDVVFRSTTAGQTLGSLTTAAAYQPLLFLESAKTSTVESAVATVYAQGGRGNPRLLAWDGDKTVTFKFEEALMSPSSFAALSGAIASTKSTMYLHLTEKVSPTSSGAVSITGITGGLSKNTSSDIKLLKLDSNGDVSSLISYNGTSAENKWTGTPTTTGNGTASGTISGITLAPFSISGITISGVVATVSMTTSTGYLQAGDSVYISGATPASGTLNGYQTITSVNTAGTAFTIATSATGSVSLSSATVAYTGQVLVDFYVDVASQTDGSLEISAEKFAGYYYLEANTLFRGTDGRDYPAQFTIPRAKIQSNFTFTMASTGDPSVFDFTLDAFPATTRFGTKKVLFTLDVADQSSDVI
jgi:hypothetical protein